MGVGDGVVVGVEVGEAVGDTSGTIGSGVITGVGLVGVGECDGSNGESIGVSPGLQDNQENMTEAAAAVNPRAIIFSMNSRRLMFILFRVPPK